MSVTESGRYDFSLPEVKTIQTQEKVDGSQMIVVPSRFSTFFEADLSQQLSLLSKLIFHCSRIVYVHGVI